MLNGKDKIISVIWVIFSLLHISPLSHQKQECRVLWMQRVINEAPRAARRQERKHEKEVPGIFVQEFMLSI